MYNVEVSVGSNGTALVQTGGAFGVYPIAALNGKFSTLVDVGLDDYMGSVGAVVRAMHVSVVDFNWHF